MKRVTIEMTFIDRILGTEQSNPDIYRDYILSKAPDPCAAAKELDFMAAAKFRDDIKEMQSLLETAR